MNIPPDILNQYILPLLIFSIDGSSLEGIVSEKDLEKWCYHIKPHGEIINYWSNGVLSSHVFWKDGKLDKEYVRYHLNGNLDMSCFFHNGEYNGNLKAYSLNGKMIMWRLYDHGLLIKDYFKELKSAGVIPRYTQDGIDRYLVLEANGRIEVFGGKKDVTDLTIKECAYREMCEESNGILSDINLGEIDYIVPHAKYAVFIVDIPYIDSHLFGDTEIYTGLKRTAKWLTLNQIKHSTHRFPGLFSGLI